MLNNKVISAEFNIIESLPYVRIMCGTYDLYNDIKQTMLIDYQGLYKIEANIEQAFNDSMGEIIFSINTHKSEFNITLKENNIFHFKNIKYNRRFLRRFIRYIKMNTGVYLQVAILTEKHKEEFFISIRTVMLDDSKICNDKFGDLNFLPMPKESWFRDDGIISSGLSIGWYGGQHHSDRNALISLISPNSNFQSSRIEQIEIIDGYITNLNFIIEEFTVGVRVKYELLSQSQGNQTTGTIEIESNYNYQLFKEFFYRDQFAYVSFLTFDDYPFKPSKHKVMSKTRNIIIVDNIKKAMLLEWCNPNELDLGGFDACKKFLIHKDTLQVGIYKFIYLSSLNTKDIRKLVNEIIACTIATALKIPVVETTFHMEPDSIGIISLLVQPPSYRLSQIEDLNEQNIRVLIDMIAFDIFLCNKDRHEANILFTKNQTGYQPFLIDHTRILGGIDDYALDILQEDYMFYSIHHSGLTLLEKYISDITPFESIIKRIKLLDVNELIEDILPDELLRHIYASNAYNKDFLTTISGHLVRRQRAMETIITKSLGFS